MKTSRTPVSVLGLLLVGGCVINGGDSNSTDTDPATTTGPSAADSSSGTTTSSSSGIDDSSSGATDVTGSSGLDESSSGTTGAAGFVHCEPGPEKPLSGTAMGSFVEANEDMETDTMPLSTPAGGYVTATFSPGLARGGVFAFGGGEMDVFNTVEQDYEEPVDIAFLAAPGTSYRLEGRQQGNANPDEYPFDWSLSWSVTPIPDCWEPNDTLDDASEIEIGHAISGYTNAGQVDRDPVPRSGWLDFYRFEVPEAGALTVDMTQVPGDGLVRVRVLDEAGGQVGSIAHPSEEAAPFSGVVDVEAGTYFVRVDAFLRPTQTVADDTDGLPSSWTTPYVFALMLDPA